MHETGIQYFIHSNKSEKPAIAFNPRSNWGISPPKALSHTTMAAPNAVALSISEVYIFLSGKLLAKNLTKSSLRAKPPDMYTTFVLSLAGIIS
jgi:hypothetical protein